MRGQDKDVEFNTKIIATHEERPTAIKSCANDSLAVIETQKNVIIPTKVAIE